MHGTLIRKSRVWRRESRATLALAFPIMAGMVSQMLMGLADTVMIGRVGVVPLAACSLVNAVAHLPLVLGIGLLSAIAVLTSHAFGARRPDEAGEVLRHGVFLSSVTGFLAAVMLVLCLLMLGKLKQPPEVVDAAGPYLLLFAASMIPALIAHGCKQFAEALKHPWAPTAVLLGGVALNVLLNWIFIYGHWGSPAMGLKGAGLATLLARVAMAAAMLWYVLRSKALTAFQPASWRIAFSPGRFRALLTVGWPVGLQHFLEVGAFALALLMMGWISTEAIAAHQIAITCAAMTFMFALGIGMAICIRVGHALGAGQYSRMRRIGFGGVALASSVMALFGLMFMFGGEWIASFFIQSPPVIVLAGQLLIVAAVFQIADGVQVVSLSALRGLADVRMPAVIAGVAYWLLALPIGAALAFFANLGPVGIWIGLATGLGAAAVSLSVRFYARTRPEHFPAMREAGHRRASAMPELNKNSPKPGRSGKFSPLLPDVEGNGT